MDAEDVIVEYRDWDLTRKGQIPFSDLSIKFQPVRNGVGSWSVLLPAEHTAAKFLRKPGTGILITDVKSGEVLMSGPTTRPSSKQTSQDLKGMVTIGGVSDDCILWDGRAWPNPDLLVEAQTEGHDIRTGNGETVIRQYVSVNIGPGAIADRRSLLASKLILEADQGRGGLVTKSARFPKLGELANEIATLTGLRFRVVQRGDNLVLEIREVEDKTDIIRLDVANGTLDEQSVEFSAPVTTRVIVAGQGEGADRTLIMRRSAESTAAETQWGRIMEEFKDQRNTNDITELEQSGDEILETDGFTRTSVKAVPSNDLTMVYMKDWNLGDRVTVVVDGQETESVVTEAAVVIDHGGMMVGAAIGDVTKFNTAAALQSQVSDTQRRVEQIERTVEQNRQILWKDVLEKPDLLTTAALPRKAWIDPFWTSGKPRITLEGETQMTTQGYPWLDSFTPQRGDNVLVIPTANDMVIAGRIKEGNQFLNQIELDKRNGWRDYSGGWAGGAVTKSPDGIVILTGLIAVDSSAGAASGTVIAKLPEGFRPDMDDNFGVNHADNSRVISIRANGDITLRSGFVGGFISLNGIAFPAAGVANWTTVKTFLNGFEASYTEPQFAPPGYWVAPNGICWLRGGVKRTNPASLPADNAQFFALPANAAAKKQNHLITSSQDNFGAIGVGAGATPGIEWKNGTSGIGHVGLAGAFYETVSAPANLYVLQSLDRGSNYGPNFTQFSAAQTNGYVMLQGLVGGLTIGTGSKVFPAGMRSNSVNGQLFHRTSAQARGRLDISGSGNVVPLQGSSAWMSFDNLIYAPQA